MNFFRALICAALLAASNAAQGAGAEFSADVIAVLDGDTVLIRRGQGVLKIRLAEIDAPEVGHAGKGGPTSGAPQPFGEASARSLAGMVLGKPVHVSSQATDSYGRMVAHLSLNGLDVNAEQIRRGLAWEYSHYHRNSLLVALQQEARQARRGLWAQSDPVPPWDWRKQTQEVTAEPAACGNGKHCSEMRSCEEAHYYLTQCGVKTMDGDGDGMPCEQLCAKAVAPK